MIEQKKMISTRESAGRIDPRLDISIRREEVTETKTFRKLSLKEQKKIKRLHVEDKKIFDTHANLLEAENEIMKDCKKVYSHGTQPLGLVSILLDYQLRGVEWMKDRELSCVRGGILADEMGMGKTLQMLALVMSGSKEDRTLVVLPAIALLQWVSEINLHAPNQFNIFVHHGRTKLTEEKASDCDMSKFNIFLTTYGTVESDFRRRASVLHKMSFHRLVLDEAHSIKDSKSSTNLAISHLVSNVRWGLTGTPVQNRIADLFALVKYLRLYPQSFYFCKKCPCKSVFWLRRNEQDGGRRGFCVCGHFSSVHFGWWNRKIGTPIKEVGYTEHSKEVFDKLHRITSKIVLRRTKLGIEKELGIPSKVVIVVRNYFSPGELDFYTSLYTETQSKYKEYAVKGEVVHNYANIFELLQKMRMAVNHPYLVYRSKDNLFGDIPICGYCNEEADDPIISKCKHVFCREEAKLFLEESQRCPVCKIKITIDLNQNHELDAKPMICTENWMSSTKIEYLVQELTMMKSRTSTTKSLVFSQFVNFLEILRWRLERAGFRCVKIYGSMSISQRKAAIEAFNTNKDITVFLISLKAGGVALNLTEASHVFIMDLWWNPAVEEQAMDRIHRIGQHRPIRIHKVIIEDSIESRILALQSKKKALFESAVENKHSALQRLSEEDLAFLFG